MTTTYEGMFLLDNQAVREDWKVAKGLVTETMAKHGVTVKTARRWDERRLAYSVAHRKRGTYLLTYFEAEPAAIKDLRRDYDLSERVLRYLILASDAVPEGELELAAAEETADFSVPLPPEDDEEPLEEAAAETEGSDKPAESSRKESKGEAAPTETEPETDAKADAKAEDRPAEPAPGPADGESFASETEAPATGEGETKSEEAGS